MIAAIVPVHDEEALLATTLLALTRMAASHQTDAKEDVRIFVVLDACSDGSKRIAEMFDVTVLEIEARNVGRARAVGAEAALAAGARWLAFTDADTCVPLDWLMKQLCHRADAFCGQVAVDRFQGRGEGLRERFQAQYQRTDGHRHIHGANLGVSAVAYRAAGGFPALSCHEDVELVRALERNGARIAWMSEPSVMTSGRVKGRAEGGFATFLASLDLGLETALVQPRRDENAGCTI
ncbi:MAG: glycosyltransferase [Chthoniobacterales bacterium]